MSPSPAALALGAAALVAGALAAWSKIEGRRRAHLVTKPLATALIVAVAALAPLPAPPVYKTLVLAGLGFSLLGDAALMFPDRWFTAGLAAFLAAQCLYILAFRPRPGQPPSAMAFLPFVLYGLLMFFLLAPHLGPMKFPVFVYIAAITAMAGLAAARYIDRGGTKPLLAFAGAALFLVSDSVLAYDRFARKVPGARVIVLGTYFPAQLLIALSV
ncbi:MAG TPA: lysoplasmalogenase [Candidatus Aminicenantes bacterium]|nr:lysoplasmalogenase [Candidatus Aminicenantes bacterium]